MGAPSKFKLIVDPGPWGIGRRARSMYLPTRGRSLTCPMCSPRLLLLIPASCVWILRFANVVPFHALGVRDHSRVRRVLESLLFPAVLPSPRQKRHLHDRVARQEIAIQTGIQSAAGAAALGPRRLNRLAHSVGRVGGKCSFDVQADRRLRSLFIQLLDRVPPRQLSSAPRVRRNRG